MSDEPITLPTDLLDAVRAEDAAHPAEPCRLLLDCLKIGAGYVTGRYTITQLETAIEVTERLNQLADEIGSRLLAFTSITDIDVVPILTVMARVSTDAAKVRAILQEAKTAPKIAKRKRVTVAKQILHPDPQTIQ